MDKQADSKKLHTWFSVFLVKFLSLAVFVAGLLAIFASITPLLKARLLLLKQYIPLFVLEASHLITGLFGLLLLFLAKDLNYRQRRSYYLTMFLLIAAILVLLLKGLELEIALILVVILLLFFLSRSYFYRGETIYRKNIGFSFSVLLLLALIFFIVLGLYHYRTDQYSQALWLRFSFSNGDAPRFLRLVVVLLTAGLLLVWQRWPVKPHIRFPEQNSQEWQEIKNIVARAPRVYANLAFLGDKQFLWSSTRKSFIMYGIEGRSCIAFGDPLGEPSEFNELIWQYREMCDQYYLTPVFTSIVLENTPFYYDIGLQLFKGGEDALVKLADFTLEGSQASKLRYTLQRLAREGCTFEIIPKEQLVGWLPELKLISDTWLSEKNTREKKFSLGCFQEEYLKNFDFALVRRNNTPIAFANILRAGNKNEISIDLMRYLPESPASVMEFLIINLILYAQKEGYQYFNLGAAPLSGIATGKYATLWNKLSYLIYRYASYFYNFQGLRQYKEKFNPEWVPSFIATQGGLSFPRAVIDIAKINSGGLKEILTR